jgi:hypothetical protein
MDAVSTRISTENLPKGQQRKLKFLRRSLGKKVADKAFRNWVNEQRRQEAARHEAEAEAERVAQAVWSLVKRGEVQIPRGGYLVRRGRRRVIVEPVRTE